MITAGIFIRNTLIFIAVGIAYVFAGVGIKKLSAALGVVMSRISGYVTGHGIPYRPILHSVLSFLVLFEAFLLVLHIPHLANWGVSRYIELAIGLAILAYLLYTFVRAAGPAKGALVLLLEAASVPIVVVAWVLKLVRSLFGVTYEHGAYCLQDTDPQEKEQSSQRSPRALAASLGKKMTAMFNTPLFEQSPARQQQAETAVQADAAVRHGVDDPQGAPAANQDTE